jgi:hypothetical protein
MFPTKIFFTLNSPTLRQCEASSYGFVARASAQAAVKFERVKSDRIESISSSGLGLHQNPINSTREKLGLPNFSLGGLRTGATATRQRNKTVPGRNEPELPRAAEGAELQALVADNKSMIALQQAMNTLLEAGDLEIVGKP